MNDSNVGDISRSSTSRHENSSCEKNTKKLIVVVNFVRNVLLKVTFYKIHFILTKYCKLPFKGPWAFSCKKGRIRGWPLIQVPKIQSEIFMK